MNERETLLTFYQEERQYCLHHESQRATATGLIASLCAASLAFISIDSKLTTADLPLSLFLIFVGTMGALLAHKHYERWKFHDNRADALRAHIADLAPPVAVTSILAQADNEHYSRFKLKYSLRKAWIVVNLAIALLGTMLTVWICL